VLITGATSGYGAVVARYAAERGATVIMASRSKSNLMLTEKSILKNCPEAIVQNFVLSTKNWW
jgi:short-subunit dehydrogenase